jgi:tetratricopeptide (TPR) repeat protein
LSLYEYQSGMCGSTLAHSAPLRIRAGLLARDLGGVYMALAACRSPALTLLACVGFLLVVGVARADLATLDQPGDTVALRKEVEMLADALRREPGQAKLHLLRGFAYFKLRELDAAIADFDRALSLDPSLDDAYFGRGMAHGRAGDLDAAVLDLGQYIARNPESTLGYTKRGIRNLWKGDAEAAERDFLRALELDPANAEAHDDLGVIYAQRGEYTKATEHFRACIKSDPSYQKAYHNFALVCYLVGHNDQGLSLVDHSLRLRPDARDSMLLKAEFLDRLGRAGEARAIREEAEFLPEGNWSERATLQ